MIAIACDHSALDMKRNIEELLDEMGLEYMDFGTDSTASCDYPVFAVRGGQRGRLRKMRQRDSDLRHRHRDVAGGE